MNTEIETKPSNESTVAQRQAYRRPSYNIDENENAYEVDVFIPGVGKSGVDISLEDSTLTIVGTRQATRPSEGAKVLRREIAQADYRLQLELNVPINREAIDARVEDGVLVLNLPKAEEAKPRRIAVS